jgi:pilus assembly protein CpaB
VSGFVLPGDRVDVLATVDGRGANTEAVTKTILQNAEVLASGQKTAQQDNKPITVQAVTILVDPVGAEKLALALHEGKLHLVLRNPEDSDTLRVGSLGTSEMLSGNPTNVAKPRSVSRAKARPATTETAPPPPVRQPTQRTTKPVVRIIREAKVTDQPAPGTRSPRKARITRTKEQGRWFARRVVGRDGRGRPRRSSPS